MSNFSFEFMDTLSIRIEDCIKPNGYLSNNLNKM